MRLSHLKASYPDFQEIYRSHFQAAKFNAILKRDKDFEARKLRLVSVRHLLGKHPRLRPEERGMLVQSLLRGDFDNAQSILQESKRLPAIFTLVASPISAFFTSPSDGGSLKREMKRIAARLSDSQFLCETKSVDDEDLQPMIQEIEILSCSILSSTIETTVGTMARVVVAMQHEVFNRTLQNEIENEERRARSEALVMFIRKLNALLAGRSDWYVGSDLIKSE